MRHPIYTNLKPIMQSLSGLAPAPSYIPPAAELTPFTRTQYEVGQTVAQNLTRGWIQNNAGNLTSSVIAKNGTTIQTITSLPTIFSINETAALGTTTYRHTVVYQTGPILNNSLGYPDTRGQIIAGNVFVERSYSGFYGYFYGSVATIPGNLRTLPLSSLGTSNTIPGFFVGQRNIVIVIPNTTTLQSVVVSETNENITGNFTLTNITLNDAGGVSRNYKQYVATTTIPLNANLNTITLS